jgi:hypothetical protein
MLLIHRRNSGGFRQTYFAAVGRELPQDQFEQGGFPHPVASDQPDLGPDWKGNSRGIEEATAPAVEHEIVDLKHVEEHQRRGQAVGKGEGGVPYRSATQIARTNVSCADSRDHAPAKPVLTFGGWRNGGTEGLPSSLLISPL